MSYDINGGWIPANEVWTYASVDGHTFVFTAPGDLTTKYSLGMKVTGLNNSTQFYGFITKLAHSAGTTTITCYGGTDYTLANSAITLPYYSTAKAPFGFPMNPAKWLEETLSTGTDTQSSPTTATWYNAGALQLVIPIGEWTIEYQGLLGANNSSSVNQLIAFATLSTANNTESDVGMTSQIRLNTAAFAGMQLEMEVYRNRPSLILTSKTTYYLNVRDYTGISAQVIGWNVGQLGIQTAIRARSAYL